MRNQDPVDRMLDTIKAVVWCWAEPRMVIRASRPLEFQPPNNELELGVSLVLRCEFQK